MSSFQTPEVSREPLRKRCGGEDRRAKPSFPPRLSAYRRRRSSGRRKTDEARYVDVYDSSTWAIAISILVLSLLDAILTSMQVASGRAQEANPLMGAVLIHGGQHTFISLKLALTAMPLAIIVLHKEWSVARFAARMCLWAYILLTCYHLYLFLSLPR